MNDGTEKRCRGGEQFRSALFLKMFFLQEKNTANALSTLILHSRIYSHRQGFVVVKVRYIISGPFPSI